MCAIRGCPRRPKAAEWFGCLDSNQDYQVQSLASCRLDDPGMFFRSLSRSAAPNDVFVPLAYPSALDRHRRRQRPTWRGFGARASHAVPEIGRLKHTRIASVSFRRTAPRDFLSQAGPRFELDWFQAEHHLGFHRGLSSPETKKATRWVALVWLVVRLGD